MKLVLPLIACIAFTSNVMATEFLGKKSYEHTFTDPEVKMTTTSSFTSYDYGEPTVRSHESVDEIQFTGEKAKNLFNQLKTFYKAKRKGNGYIAVLDTNYHVIAEDMIIIECVSKNLCSLRYDQEKKAEILRNSGYPKYQAGIVGDFINHRGMDTINEALNDIIRLKERGSIDDTVLFSDRSPKGVLPVSFSLGAVAPLMRDAGICEEFSRPGCSIYCRGSRNTNRDTKFAGNCSFKLELKKTVQK